MTTHVTFNGVTLCNKKFKGYPIEQFIKSAFRCGMCCNKLKTRGYDLKALEKRFKDEAPIATTLRRFKDVP